jgi:hypothetical protein
MRREGLDRAPEGQNGEPERPVAAESGGKRVHGPGVGAECDGPVALGRCSEDRSGAGRRDRSRRGAGGGFEPRRPDGRRPRPGCGMVLWPPVRRMTVRSRVSSDGSGRAARTAGDVPLTLAQRAGGRGRADRTPGRARRPPSAVPLAVAAHVTAAHGFTAPSSPAHPAVTLARAASDTFVDAQPAADPPGPG